jgi:mono/diheme cytochrome c family protein
MKRCAAAVVLGAGLLVAASGTAAPPGKAKVDPGKLEYEVSCALCHGMTGKGDGPYKLAIPKAPTDLTQLAKQNAGTFPFNRVYETIDGRKDVGAHGTRDMPIWGQRYQQAAAEYYIDVPYDPDVYVRGRILALTEYVNRLQAK